MLCVRWATIKHFKYMWAIITFKWAMRTHVSKTECAMKEQGGPVAKGAKSWQVLQSPAVLFGCNKNLYYFVSPLSALNVGSVQKLQRVIREILNMPNVWEKTKTLTKYFIWTVHLSAYNHFHELDFFLRTVRMMYHAEYIGSLRLHPSFNPPGCPASQSANVQPCSSQDIMC